MKKVYLLEKIDWCFGEFNNYIERKGYKTKEEAIEALYSKGYNIAEENHYKEYSDNEYKSPYIENTGVTYYDSYDSEDREDWYHILELEL